MYEVAADRAESLLNEADQREESREQHYLFTDKPAEDLEQITEFYSIVKADKGSRMLHIKKDSRNIETEIDTSKVVSALRKEGYRPFIKLDIRRHVLEQEGEEIVLEKVQNLGYFIDKERIGGRKAFYGDILLEKMQSDSESREQVIKEAREIL